MREFGRDIYIYIYTPFFGDYMGYPIHPPIPCQQHSPRRPRFGLPARQHHLPRAGRPEASDAVPGTSHRGSAFGSPRRLAVRLLGGGALGTDPPKALTRLPRSTNPAAESFNQALASQATRVPEALQCLRRRAPGPQRACVRFPSGTGSCNARRPTSLSL